MLVRNNDRLMLSDKVYSSVKKLVQIILPAFSSLYFGLAGIWGLPNPEKVVGTIAVITTFLGVCLGISTKQYNASEAGFVGEMVITTTPTGGKQFSLNVNGDPLDMEDRDEVTFKVSKPEDE